MSLWDFFNFGKSTTPEQVSGLPSKLGELLPELDDQTRAKIAAISGLLACVAHTDFNVCDLERGSIENSLLTWCKLSDQQAKAVATLAIDEVKALASLDVHHYTNTLDKILSDEERVGVLEMLFQLAASDDEVDIEESEFIRHVGHGLRLDHHEFVAARATVIAHLKILKKS
tara:strand:- start:1522 stop:2037 length:516 start_codon:yes stop_codon:yes gene_type:complete